jgi:P2-related tail formation protein
VDVAAPEIQPGNDIGYPFLVLDVPRRVQAHFLAYLFKALPVDGWVFAPARQRVARHVVRQSKNEQAYDEQLRNHYKQTPYNRFIHILTSF